VAISFATFPDPGLSFGLGTQEWEANAVVVATGENFPDALAAASLAVRANGPVLLTPSNSLPGIVADEIVRLDPEQIFVVGGTAAVSNTVFHQLNSLAPTTRIAGADRYQTAVEISRTAFPIGSCLAYLAVGTNFPDALTGAAQAAAWGAPVLLTPTGSLPQAVADELVRLDPYVVIILGGEAVVSPAVQAQLEALLGL
jgi:putative cell wall-binding protein